MTNFRLAVATDGKDGLQDVVSKVFGRANTFTIMDVHNNEISNVKVLENSAASYHHGAGPIAVKMLIDEGVNIVLANKLGFGASELLKQHDVTLVLTKPGLVVEDVAKNSFLER